MISYFLVRESTSVGPSSRRAFLALAAFATAILAFLILSNFVASSSSTIPLLASYKLAKAPELLKIFSSPESSAAAAEVSAIDSVTFF